MLERYFGFQEDPFGVTPNPRYLYPSHTHREALASLNYGFQSNRGFTALIAPPGMGKTSLLRHFLDDIQNRARTAYLFDVQCEPIELLNYMLRDLGVAPGRNGIEMREQLKGILVSEANAGRTVVAVIDEAQTLSDAQLEMLRLLSNFETQRAKLMQIVLAGQPALADTLMKPSMEQLRQRISTICRLDPLTREETTSYIRYRLKQAGYDGPPLFTQEAFGLIAEASHGIPRTINNLCFNSLSLCSALNAKSVEREMAAEAILDQQLSPRAAEFLASFIRTAGSIAGHTEAAPPLNIKPDQHEASFGRGHRWVPAAAVIVALLLAALLSYRLWPSLSRIAAEQNTVKSLFQSSPPSLEFAAADTTIPVKSLRKANSFEITVEPDQKLHDICIKYFGKFDLELFHEIMALNPRLTNPDHIEAGQRLWLPNPPKAQNKHSDSPPLISPLNLPGAEDLSNSGAEDSVSKTASFEVTAGAHQTLGDLAIKYLGSVNSKLLHQIQLLNPTLTDPSQIVEGQKVRLPAPSPRPIADNSMYTAIGKSTP
jgi:general secretion pathway protein A